MNNKNKYVGGSSVSDVEPDDRDKQAIDEYYRERRNRLLLAAGALAIVAIGLAIYLAVVSEKDDGESRSIELVETYMEGLSEADTDKVQSVMDEDISGTSLADTLSDTFAAFEEYGAKYSVEYTMGDGYEADDDDLDAVAESLYESSASASDITEGYIVPVSMTVTLTISGQTTTETSDMDIICYSKDGEWYLGGSITDSTDTTDTTDTTDSADTTDTTDGTDAAD